MIGRKNEITTLDRLYNSNRAQFVAVYGRRRVGKTYLIRIIRNRISLLEKELSPKMAIHSTLITTFGLKYNEYSGDFVNVINMDALFE